MLRSFLSALTTAVFSVALAVTFWATWVPPELDGDIQDVAPAVATYTTSASKNGGDLVAEARARGTTDFPIHTLR